MLEEQGQKNRGLATRDHASALISQRGGWSDRRPQVRRRLRSLRGKSDIPWFGSLLAAPYYSCGQFMLQYVIVSVVCC